MIRPGLRTASAVLVMAMAMAAACGDKGEGVAPPRPPVVAGESADIAWDRIAICAGDRHTCVTTPSGRVACTGDGLDGQIGGSTRRLALKSWPHSQA